MQIRVGVWVFLGDTYVLAFVTGSVDSFAMEHYFSENDTK